MSKERTDASLHLSLVSYLDRTGWQRISRGSGGELWATDPSAELDVTAVPNHVRDGSLEFEGAAQRIAAKEKRAPEAVADDIRHEFFDLQAYKIGDAFLLDDAAPLEAAGAVLTAAQRILRAAGTTSRRPTASIRGNFSRSGDEIAGHARLSHTRKGSFVLPVIMPVVTMDEPQDLFTDVVRGIETAERVLTRTAASALRGLDQAVVKPDRAPSRDEVLDLIDVGVSAELVSAVRNITRQSGVHKLDASFRWSPAVTGGERMPTQVVIPEEASTLLSDVVKVLRQAQPDPEVFISGRVIDIRHIPDDPYGSITLRVLRSSRFVEVQVRVSTSVIHEAHDWMRKGRIVSTRGTLERRPGQPLRMLNASNVEPLDEIFDESTR
ncbi:hypothetical protein [Curtobacterium flaccumfaciens]|uniref:hypothetical protein n=1 Tax=Curtobacterium flaccumfaciens TaxID=2035 RepID=UPI000FFF400B|nr:hypothetical protein [Curtobacterium flaccumfaciens]MCS0644977.1 hypothetical protein [Curtobacterium flaccumfaciens pv. flaccumfaciens]MCS6526735.1 hypothetical protein [Curtobacterium flaccumfaciens pv. flaccumfaciens]NUU12122.1 hypothetical protein [Curtobacterium flaccumfaciens]